MTNDLSEPTRSDAVKLLQEYTKSESLLRHALNVEAAMLWYAKHYDQSPEEQVKWGICGLLHDFDYEIAPTSDPVIGHPYFGNKILTDLGYSEEIRIAIMGHALYTNTTRESLMAKTLFAVDEMTGLIMASSLVRPDKLLANVKVSSIKKKFKNKSFAAGCNREEMIQGAEELGINLDQHIANVLAGMQILETKLTDGVIENTLST